MSSTYTSILVGVISLVLVILLLSKMAKFPFPTMDYTMGVKKFNRSESTEKIHACRD